MPLYAELQIGAELIIYPLPIPRDKEHYKVNRMLEGSTVQVNGITPLHLFNGELLYAKETGRIQRVEFNVRPSDTAAKEQAERTMNKLVEAMKEGAKAVDETLDVLFEKPKAASFVQKLDSLSNDTRAFVKSRYQNKLEEFSFAEQKPKDDFSDNAECKHRRTDYFIGTGIVCRDCKKKLRV